MFARVTMLEIDTMRVSVDEALRTFVETALPDLRQQPGYEGIVMLSTPEGKGLVVSLWAGEQEAEASSPEGFYAEVLAKFVTFFKSPPGRDRYEVLYTELPAPAIS